MISFNSIADLIKLAEDNNTTISDIVVKWEEENSQTSPQQQYEVMARNWEVMQESIEKGITNQQKSLSGLTGGDAVKLEAYKGKGYTGEAVLAAAASAVGVSEVNAVMGRIVACPTAGSCGIVPAAVKAAAEKNGNTEEEIVNALKEKFIK